MRFFAGQRRFRGLPAPATRGYAEPVGESLAANVPRESESLRSLARALMAARLGEALVLPAARGCRMDDLQQAVGR